jgi:hypothetical protein
MEPARPRIKGTYSNSTGKGKLIPSGGNLHIYSVKGCTGLFNNGDPATVSGSYTATPKQTATSP